MGLSGDGRGQPGEWEMEHLLAPGRERERVWVAVVMHASAGLLVEACWRSVAPALAPVTLPQQPFTFHPHLVPSLAPAPTPRRPPPPTILQRLVNSIPWHPLIGRRWPRRVLNTNDVGTRLATMLATSLHSDRTPQGKPPDHIAQAVGSSLGGVPSTAATSTSTAGATWPGQTTAQLISRPCMDRLLGLTTTPKHWPIW